MAGLTLFFFLFSANARCESKLGLGVSYLGGQIRYHLNPRWAGELRYQTGTASSNSGEVTSQVIGLRGYRFLEGDSRLRFFFGGEAASVAASQKNTSYKTSGMAAGGFAGLEYSFGKKFSLGLDIGPYFLSLKETTQDVSDSSLEFIANTAFTFYLF